MGEGVVAGGLMEGLGLEARGFTCPLLSSTLAVFFNEIH